jgi:DNA invertase Pin-like site-specific DNA recombinase
MKRPASATASRKRREGHLVAYLRVSATDQSLATQLAKVKALGNSDKVFKEKASGLKDDRPVLAECLAYLRDGDTLVVTRADRIARSAAHLLGTVQALKKKGVAVRFLDQPELNTEGKYADFLLTVLAGVAQLERDIMDEKRRDGIAAARTRGVRFGRPRLINEKLQAEAVALKESGLAMPEVARRLNLGVSTTYRLLAEAQRRCTCGRTGEVEKLPSQSALACHVRARTAERL